MSWLKVGDKYINFDHVMRAQMGIQIRDNHVIRKNGQPVEELSLFFSDGALAKFQDVELKIVERVLDDFIANKR